jgi:hypothetical protein
VVVVVVELKEHHHHTHTALFQSEGAGSKAGIPGWVLWLSFRQVHARKGIEGLDGAERWAAVKIRQGHNMHRLRSAGLHLDGKDSSSSSKLATKKTSQRQQRRTALLHCRGREMV